MTIAEKKIALGELQQKVSELGFEPIKFSSQLHEERISIPHQILKGDIPEILKKIALKKGKNVGALKNVIFSMDSFVNHFVEAKIETEFTLTNDGSAIGNNINSTVPYLAQSYIFRKVKGGGTKKLLGHLKREMTRREYEKLEFKVFFSMEPEKVIYKKFNEIYQEKKKLFKEARMLLNEELVTEIFKYRKKCAALELEQFHIEIFEN